MALPHYEMGQWAVQYLVGRAEGLPLEPLQHSIPCRLIERASIKPR
jgi:LacI family transcriptional regulator